MPDAYHPPRARKSSLPLRYRLAVASRVLAACVGGYYVAYGSTALLTVLLPWERINRVMTASLLSFVVWCVAAFWVFAARHSGRAWWPLLLAGSVMMGAALVMREQGMRP
ncbi:MAG: hypothetical protein ABW154_06625 [Dyella sp.]